MPGTAEVGFVDIELDKPRRLRYDTTALAVFERLNDGKSAWALLSNMENLGISMVAKLLYAGLIHEDDRLARNITGGPIQCEKLMESAPGETRMDKFQYVFSTVQDAVTTSWGLGDEEKNQEAPEKPGL